MALGVTLAASAARADGEQWADDARWVSVRFGLAKITPDRAPDGSLGYGFGYQRFLDRKWSWGAFVHHEVVGRYGEASLIEVPVTVEFARHFAWKTPARPYVGMGWGGFYAKTYKTGDDESKFRTGGYLTTGINAAIDDHSLLGLDVRLIVERGTRSTNPIFANAKSSTVGWSVKLNYARVL